MWKHLIFTSGAGVGCVPHGPIVVVIRGNVVVVTTLVVVLVFGTDTLWELPAALVCPKALFMDNIPIKNVLQRTNISTTLYGLDAAAFFQKVMPIS